MSAHMQDLILIIQNLMSPDNNIRGNAETQFDTAKGQPEWLIPSLVTILKQHENVAVKQMSAILLKKCVTYDSRKGQGDLYESLSPDTQAQLRASLLELIMLPGLPGNIRKHIDLAVSTLGSRTLDVVVAEGQPAQNRWPELLPFIFEAVQKGVGEVQCSALAILGGLVNYLLDTQLLRDNMNSIGTTFSACLQHADPKVRVTAVETTMQVVQVLSDEDYLRPFCSLVPMLMNCVSQALNSQREDDAHEIIDHLVSVAESNAEFFVMSGFIADMFNAMFMVAQSETLEDKVRQLAIEFMITFAEAEPRNAKKVPQFLDRIVPFLMNWMLTPGNLDDPDWGNNIEDDDEIYNYDVGLEGLDRLAISIGGKAFEKPLGREIHKYLTANPADWRYRHAAVLAMSQTAEGCKKQFEPNLANMTTKVLGLFSDPHPRVRFTSVQCIAQFCTDFQPGFQAMFTDMVIPALTKMLEDPVARIRHHAAAGIVNFCDEAQPSLYEKHVEKLLVTLYGIMDQQDQPMFLKEQILSAVSAVAENCEERFSKFYDNFMPIMKVILIQLPEAKEHRTVKGKAIECASFIACAAGKDRFSAPSADGTPDHQIIMGYMHQLTQQQLEADDPRNQYLVQAWARLAKCIGPAFVQYLDAVIPTLLMRCKSSDDVTVLDGDEEPDDDSVQCIKLAIKGIGEKKLAIRTSILEDKSLALSMLLSYFSTLDVHLFPWVERIAEATFPLLSNPYLEDIRESSAQICPLLLKCTLENAKVGHCPPQAVTQLLNIIVPKLIEALRAETEANVAGTLMENYAECLDVCGKECLPPEVLAETLETIREVFEESLQRRAGVTQEAAEVGDDEDEQAKLDEQAEAEENLLTQTIEVIGKLVKTHPAAFIPSFIQKFLPYFTSMLDTQKYSSLEHKLALCVLDDFVEYGHDTVTPYFASIVSALHTFVGSRDPDVGQACVYGMGVCANWVAQQAQPPRAFADGAVARSLELLKAMLTEGSKKVAKGEEEWAAPVCNAVSSLLKFLRLFRGQPGISDQEILPCIFPVLPVQGDEIEAQLVHQEIFEYVRLQNPVVIGAGGANMPAIQNIARKLLVVEPGEDPLINFATREQLHVMLGMPPPPPEAP